MPMIRRASFATPGGSEKSLLAFVKHVKKLSCTREPSFCLAALMLSSVLPHTRFCKASRGGGAFSGLVCLDRKCACSASTLSLDVVPFTLLCQHFIAMPKGRISGLLGKGYRMIDSPLRTLTPKRGILWCSNSGIIPSIYLNYATRKMKVLSRLPADGAFDQERPLVRLRSQKKRNSFSFDSKSATDRWPLSVIYTFMSCMWGSTLASSIVNSSLGLNTFLIVPPMVKRVSEIAFLTGQPLGYYGSWSLFALSHHYMVWLAAKYAYPTSTTPFADYALLGDDILITDTEVARQYRILLDRLGVTIS
ncbi:hypothetical protein EJD97_014317 [Solanum chilense]|uniref:RNA-dependent RNA polymerase n=1 Tax=Solanum chilense TaxID=4083 RepID=A0A6N2BBR1_SOLCI|nr:hypothetical protein EJD97_014317 [Solanum chilense]